MNDKKISLDDPRLTAYALGELELSERAEVEALLAIDPVAQATVEQIRVLAAELESALVNEPVPTPRQPVLLKPRVPLPRPAKITPFPYYWVAGVAAACFAALVIFRENSPHPATRPERKLIYELKLAGGEESLSTTEKAGVPAENLELTATDGASPTAGQVAANELPAPDAKLPDPANVFQAGTIEQIASSLRASAPSLANGDTSASNIFQPQPFPLPAVRGKLGSRRALWEREKVASSKNADENAGKFEIQPVVLSSDRSARVQAAAFDGLAVEAKDQSGGRIEKTATTVGPLAKIEYSSGAYNAPRGNEFLSVRGNPLSTFALDVDTASYANVRRYLGTGHLPPRETVRIEQLLNYFPYRFSDDKSATKSVASVDSKNSLGEKPLLAAAASPAFAASLEVASAPWNPAHRLVRIGLKGREVSDADRPPANLVLLLDASVSMDQPNKFPLVKESLRLLLEKLKPTDRLAIVTHAGSGGLVLPSTSVAQKKEIFAALDALQTQRNAEGGVGFQLAYEVAKANFVSDGINRVILCTDGGFADEPTDGGEWTHLVEEKAKSGVFLTVLGFGVRNDRDATLEKLADQGNGNYGYIDSSAEAHKILVEQVAGTLMTVAKDVKLQVEFNPAKASAYRLIGYENRGSNRLDLTKEKVDGGEMGAGQSVTALYEIIPVSADGSSELVELGAEPLKYQSTETLRSDEHAGRASAEMLTLKVRFTPPTVEISRKVEYPLVDTGAVFAAASQDFKFAAAVASFGMILAESPNKGSATYDKVLDWAETGQGEDPAGYRREFIELVKKAKSVSAE